MTHYFEGGRGMSWKYVFDMYQTMDIAYAIMMVRKTWYRFFVLGDGNVYFCKNGEAYETGLTIEELF